MFTQLAAGDIDDLDALVRSSMRTQEDQVQVDASEALLGMMMSELADELETIDNRQRSRATLRAAGDRDPTPR